MAYKGKTPKELGTANGKPASLRPSPRRRPLPPRRGACPETVQRMYTHHIVPRAQGGSDKVENLMLVCQSCHGKLERDAQEKAAKPKSKYPATPWMRKSMLDGSWQPCSRQWHADVVPNPDYHGEATSP